MKQLADDAFVDDAGQLYLLAPGKIDPYDPPGTMPPRVWSATGYTYEDVPTYGWPLSVIWDNNSLQFATESTALKMLAECRARFSGFSWQITLLEIKVGPYRWAPVRQLAASDTAGLIIKLNAGEKASQLARYPEGWQAQIARTLRDGKAKRDRDDE